MLQAFLACAALAFVGPSGLLAPRPRLARSPIITALADADLDAQLDALTQRLEILQLKAQLAELQRSAAAATSAGATTIVQAAAPVSPAEPIAAAVQAVVAAPAAVDSAAQVAAAQAATEPVVAQVVAAPEAIQAVVAAAAAAAQPSSLPFGVPFGVPFGLPTDGGVPTLALAAVLVPTVAFGGKLFIDFVEQRYAELKASEAPGDADARARSFAPPSAGNLAANRRWSEREAAAEAERASSWVSSPGGRSATEIVAKGLTNLAEDPIGWLFGEPSPLYSNVAVARPLMATPPPARPMPPAAAASAMEAPPALAVEASALAVEAPPFEGRVVPTPALAARSARRQRREGAGEGFGSRTGAGAGASPSASASASRPARVPPSTPEEVEAARRGEWDYGQFK